ncbi:lipopolysaccharide core heptose(II) kinase RfaY [Marinobacter fonticola]|uniref:lipopolysaccharide core heptose(II) kinase RfaY n=1 Tax=Marinobacter fonticola TaxID=2603215 RepID=UPI0011E745CB|nr:lipopolysaccharide core heptose(II) kinase RfaY [Marinobacter fonticola]
MPLAFDYRHYHVVSHVGEDASRELVDAVLDETLTREKVFRDNWRTLSARVRFRDESLLLKVPRARNSRRWERFLTRFRESDALRTFRHLELMSTMGFTAPVPMLACEHRPDGVVTDAFVCYRFVEGRPAEPRDALKILDALEALHRRGYLRNDPQLANFVVSGETVCFIDFRLKKPKFLPALQKARELARFLGSCPEAERLLPATVTSSGWFWLAVRLEKISLGIRKLKRRLRK